MFSAPSEFEIHHGHTLVLGSDTSCRFHPFPSEAVLVWVMLHRNPTNRLCTSCSFCLLKSIWPTRSPLNLTHNQGADDKQRNCIYVCICQVMPLLARPHYYCAKFMTVTCNQTCPSRSERALLFALQSTPPFGNKIGMRREMVRNLVPNDQFGNNVFHSQRGTRKKRS